MRQPSFSIVLRQAAAGTLAAAVLLAGTAARAGSIEAAEFKSPTLQRSWTYNVYLPTGYDAQSKLRYPVMYLLHGNDGQRNVNDASDRTGNRIRADRLTSLY
jgi:predicted alpha/beta superfamily hydrolase